jgi:hypothetical protein
MTEDHRGRRLDLSASEFRALFDAVSTWGRWGERDQGGALHHLDPAQVVAATRLVRDGATVTLSLPLNTFLTWADEFYLRSHHRSVALLDPATINTPRIHWKDG